MAHLRKIVAQPAAQRLSELRLFLTALEDRPPQHLDTYSGKLDKAVWAETDCLACANCCRNMSPAYTVADIKRIATHFRLSMPAFKAKWLYRNERGAWMNRTQPCPFLDLHTNKCTIYAILPEDCAGFPHLAKAKMVDYMHVHKQNISFCPATFRFVEKLMQAVDENTF
jgi:Fe-S-cluster containining protein